MSAGDPMDVDVPTCRRYKEITAKDDGEDRLIEIEDFPDRMKLGRETGKSTYGTESILEI